MKYFTTYLLMFLAAGCRISYEKEDPHAVAKQYCDCVTMQLTNAPDSSVNLNDCEREVYAKSRLFNIYTDYENRDKYPKATLDSALEFCLLVRDIEDTLCYNKIDFKKVKKIPHAF